ncbi:MAG: hypothetical protein GY818_06145 [Planctomycetaceae bacterium]|nr:hypothetical protein [Planctomycetaceae bacterium]
MHGIIKSKTGTKRIKLNGLLLLKESRILHKYCPSNTAHKELWLKISLDLKNPALFFAAKNLSTLFPMKLQTLFQIHSLQDVTRLRNALESVKRRVPR